MGSAPVSDPSSRRPTRCGLLGLAPHCLDSECARRYCRHSLESRTPEKPFLLASYLDQRRTGQTQRHRTLLWPCFSLLSSPTTSFVWLVRDGFPSCLDLRCFCHRWAGCSTSWSS